MKKVAIVTGGNSGMGEATVKELVRRGWQVAAMARTKVEKQFQGDVAEDADCRRVASAVLDKWGRIDALVNSAGTTKFVAHADLEGLSADDILGIFRVNLVGPFQMIRACAPALKQSRGCVVNVSSVASILGTGSSIAYAASKAAVIAMTREVAMQYAAKGIRANAILPGLMDTPMVKAQLAGAYGGDAEEMGKRRALLCPMGKQGDAWDTAHAALFLASDEAKYITGTTLTVDGGITARER